MYTLNSLKRGLKQPQLLLEEVKQLAARPHLLLRELNRLYYRRLHTWEYNEEGIDIFEADWDNFLILDACRYDLFESGSDLPGETTTVQSRASSTREFLDANFDGKTLLDTVYVTASPMLSRHRHRVDVEFHEVVNLWQEEWDEEHRTVLPETVMDAVVEAAEKFPQKRLLVHFTQPHYPFLGPTGREYFDLDGLRFQWNDVAVGDIDISDEVIYRAYAENFEEVLPFVEQLMSELRGKTVVTADHGQMIGERAFPIPVREYGHPTAIYTPELVTVPWHVFDDGPRRDIVAEASTRSRDREDEEAVAQERLEDLGYLS